jgi:exopolysaccharide production protein ExoZ
VALLMGLTLLIVAIYIQEAVIASSLINGKHLNLRVAVFGSSAVLILAAVIELEMRGRVFLPKVSTLIGGASYSIYLSHTIVITLVVVLGLHNWILQHSSWPGFWIFIIMTLTVFYSIMHYKWIEQPLMSMAKHWQHRLFRS